MRLTATSGLKGQEGGVSGKDPRPSRSKMIKIPFSSRGDETDRVFGIGAGLDSADEIAGVLLGLKARRRKITIAHMLRIVDAGVRMRTMRRRPGC